MRHALKTRGTRRALIALPIAAVAFVGTNLTSVAFATIVPTTTTVTAPASAGVGQSVTLTATVTPTGLGAGLASASGTVQFKTGTTSLGTKTLSGCPLGKPCSTTLATTALPQGQDPITAYYSPTSGLTAASDSSQHPVYVTVEPTASTTSACTEGTSCNGGTVYAANLSSSINVQTQGGNTGGGTYTIQESTGGSTLACQTITGGDVGNYLVGTNDVTETITYQLLGKAADDSHAANPNNTFDACYGSPAAFPGSTFNATNNEYEGVPPVCNATQSNTPCEVSQQFVAGNGPGGADTVTFVLVVNSATTAGGNGNGNTCSHHNGQPQNCNSADPHVGGG